MQHLQELHKSSINRNKFVLYEKQKANESCSEGTHFAASALSLLSLSENFLFFAVNHQKLLLHGLPLLYINLYKQPIHLLPTAPLSNPGIRWNPRNKQLCFRTSPSQTYASAVNYPDQRIYSPRSATVSMMTSGKISLFFVNLLKQSFWHHFFKSCSWTKLQGLIVFLQSTCCMQMNLCIFFSVNCLTCALFTGIYPIPV